MREILDPVQDEAFEQLKNSTHLEDLILICRNFPFEDPQEPSRTLNSRITWIRQQQHRRDNKRSEAAKVLLQCIPYRRPEWPEWEFTSTGVSFATPVELSQHIHHHFHSIYRAIQPVEWTRAGLGCNLSVFAMLQDRGQIIKKWLHQSRIAGRREDIETVRSRDLALLMLRLTERQDLSSRDALAHWAVFSQGSAPPEFLQRFFKTLQRREEGLICWVKRLAFLSQRLRDGLLADSCYLKLVLARASLFWDNVQSEDMVKLGASITQDDKQLLLKCSPRDFVALKNRKSHYVWSVEFVLRDEVKSCVKVDGNLTDLIGGLATVRLLPQELADLTA